MPSILFSMSSMSTIRGLRIDLKKVTFEESDNQGLVTLRVTLLDDVDELLKLDAVRSIVVHAVNDLFHILSRFCHAQRDERIFELIDSNAFFVLRVQLLVVILQLLELLISLVSFISDKLVVPFGRIRSGGLFLFGSSTFLVSGWPVKTVR